jgi:hypothetical protein
VLEIAALPDHLLDECEYREDYVPCDVTGLAVRADAFDEWQTSELCVAPPANSFYCPLCFNPVLDDTESWKNHCIYDCGANPRIVGDEEEYDEQGDGYA